MFQGGQLFIGLFWLMVFSALIAKRQLGFSGGIAVVIGMYYLLRLFNALERRDRRDRSRGE
jgi:NhaP-type Na+/H+ or K+/H+ antiporter